MFSGAVPQSPMPRGPFPEARAMRRPQPCTDQGGGGSLKTREPTLSRLHCHFFLGWPGGTKARGHFSSLSRKRNSPFFLFGLKKTGVNETLKR